MPGVMDIIVRARDEATSVLDRVGEAGEQAGGVIDRAWLPATAAMVAAGGAIEGLARKQQDQNISLRQMAARLGENEDDVRSWATEVSNAGFPLEDVTALMDLASKRGIEGREALQSYASLWDDVGDATGESAPALAEAAVGLQGIGIAAGDEAEALDALGFIMDNTTAGVGSFLDFVSRTGPELREMGVDVNDTAAILGVLENELGLTGRVARTEFREAVTQSDGTLEGMLDTLGISAEQFANWRGQVDGAGKAIERNAQIADDAMTPLQELQAGLGDLAFSFAPVVEGAADLAPLLLAAGPAAKGAQLAMTGLAKVGPMLGVAMHAALGPIGLVTGAVSLLAAGFATDFLGMRTRLETDVNDMAMNFGTMGDRVHELADRAGGDFQAMKDRIKDEMAETGQSFEEVTAKIDRELSGIPITAEKHFEAYTEVTHQQMLAAKGVVSDGVEDMADEAGSFPEKAADELLANQQRLSDATSELVDFMEQALSPAQEIFRLQGFLSSSELAEGLASNNPLVRQKAEELRDEALARLNELKGLAYGSGAGAGYSFGSGLADPAVISFVAGSARKTMLAARGIFPGSEPSDPSSPLRGISKAFGFWDVFAEGLDVEADRPAEIMARAMGLMRDEVSSDGLSVEVAGVPGGIGVGPAGGLTQIFQLIVDGQPKVIGDREDVLAAWEQEVRVSDRGGL